MQYSVILQFIERRKKRFYRTRLNILKSTSNPTEQCLLSSFLYFFDLCDIVVVAHKCCQKISIYDKKSQFIVKKLNLIPKQQLSAEKNQFTASKKIAFVLTSLFVT